MPRSRTLRHPDTRGPAEGTARTDLTPQEAAALLRQAFPGPSRAKRLTDRERLLRQVKEIGTGGWQQTVLDAAHAYGFRVMQIRRSAIMGQSGKPVSVVQADGKGWPDLFCVRPDDGRMVAIECKAHGGKATPEQTQWLGWLSDCGVRSWVLTPGDVDFEEIFG